MNRSRTQVFVVALPLMAGLILTACGGSAATDVAPTEPPSVEPTAVPAVEPTEEIVEEPEPVHLTIALSAESESMDPFFVLQSAGNSVMAAIFDALIDQTYDGSLVPGLAESWELIGDLAIQFNLRQGVQFHNGEPFNAASVEFTINRVLDEETNAPIRSSYASIDSVEVVDDYTVIVHLNDANGSIFDRISNLEMLPPEYVGGADIATIASEPVGTGPYVFVEWVPDDHVTVAKNENFWDGSYKGQPQFATITYRPITEASTRLAELVSGGVDIVQDLLPDQIQSVIDEGLVVTSMPLASHTYFLVDSDDPESPFSDVRVRQAINYAVDIPAIIDALLLGYGDQIGSVIGPSNLGYNPAVEPYPYDPEMALSLLEDAGYADGFAITLDVCTCDRTDLALAVAGQLSEVGIDIEIRELELAQFNDNWIGREQSRMWRARWGGSADPSGIEFIASCTGFITRFCDEEVTALIDAAKATLDQDVRAGYYSEIAVLMHDNPLGIYAWANHTLLGLNPLMEGFQPHVSSEVHPFSATLNVE